MESQPLVVNQSSIFILALVNFISSLVALICGIVVHQVRQQLSDYDNSGLSVTRIDDSSNSTVDRIVCCGDYTGLWFVIAGLISSAMGVIALWPRKLYRRVVLLSYFIMSTVTAILSFPAILAHTARLIQYIPFLLLTVDLITYSANALQLSIIFGGYNINRGSHLLRTIVAVEIVAVILAFTYGVISTIVASLLCSHFCPCCGSQVPSTLYIANDETQVDDDGQTVIILPRHILKGNKKACVVLRNETDVTEMTD